MYLHLTQDGTPYKVESKKLTLYIDDDDAGMKVYVPQNNDDQEYTLTKDLAQKLFECMMSHAVTHISERVSKDGVNATRDVLLAPRRRIRAALDDNGIGTIDINDLDEAPSEPETPETSTETSNRVSDADITHSSAPSDPGESDATIQFTPASSAASSTASRNDDSVVSGGASRACSPITPPARRNREDLAPSSLSSSILPPATPGQGVSASDDQSYVQLLEKVISSARRHAIPRHGTGDMSQVRVNMSVVNTGDEGDYFGLSSASQFVRNCKVGAAGELYVRFLCSYTVLFRIPRLIAVLRFSSCSLTSLSTVNSLASRRKTG